jgi:hypothetical protein
VAYRDKPELYGTSTPEERRQRRYVLWILPVIFVAPNVGRIVKAIGFNATYQITFIGTIVLGVTCLAGGLLSYRSAKAQAARDIAELSDPKG